MKYDAIFIGYGQGAHSLSLKLAGEGWKVAMVEKDANNYGGSCINIGCIPTKVLEHDAQEGRSYADAVERRNQAMHLWKKKNWKSQKKSKKRWKKKASPFLSAQM